MPEIKRSAYFQSRSIGPINIVFSVKAGDNYKFGDIERAFTSAKNSKSGERRSEAEQRQRQAYESMQSVFTIYRIYSDPVLSPDDDAVVVNLNDEKIRFLGGESDVYFKAIKDDIDTNIEKFTEAVKNPGFFWPKAVKAKHKDTLEFLKDLRELIKTGACLNMMEDVVVQKTDSASTRVPQGAEGFDPEYAALTFPSKPTESLPQAKTVDDSDWAARAARINGHMGPVSRNLPARRDVVPARHVDLHQDSLQSFATNPRRAAELTSLHDYEVPPEFTSLHDYEQPPAETPVLHINQIAAKLAVQLNVRDQAATPTNALEDSFESSVEGPAYDSLAPQKDTRGLDASGYHQPLNVSGLDDTDDDYAVYNPRTGVEGLEAFQDPEQSILFGGVSSQGVWQVKEPVMQATKPTALLPRSVVAFADAAFLKAHK